MKLNFENNKLLHAIAGLIIYLTLTLFFSFPVSLFLSALIIVGKEAYDKVIKKEEFNLQDIYWGGGGALFPFIIDIIRSL